MAKHKKPAKSKQSKVSDKEKKSVQIAEIPGEVSLERSPFRLKGRIQYLSTDIDELRNYVNENKRVKLTHAAAKFQVTKSTIEDWAKILEDHKMIDMHYPVAGDPVLKVHEEKKKRKKGDKKKQKEEKIPKMKDIPKLKDKDAPKTGKPEDALDNVRKKPHLTKKKFMVLSEVIVLSLMFIYIFVVNQRLRDNFIPTLRYQLENLPSTLTELPAMVIQLTNSLGVERLGINPILIYVAILVIFLWIVFAIVRKRRKNRYAREWTKKHKKTK